MLPRASQLESFTDVFVDEIAQENISQPISWPSSCDSAPESPIKVVATKSTKYNRPLKYTGQHGEFRSIEEIDPKFRCLFTYPYFNLVQSRIIEDALYSDKSFVLCAPTGSGKTVAFELAILQLLMQIEDTEYKGDFKIIYMAPVKAVCNERLTEWYPKLTRLGLLCIEVTGDTEVDFSQLKPYKVIITTPEKWDMLTRRWRDHRGLVEMIKLFLIDEVHILNDETRGPVLEAVVSRMKTVESAAQSAHRIEQLQEQYQGAGAAAERPPRVRFVAVSATVGNPDDVAAWLGTSGKPAVFYKFGDECRPVKLRRIVEGYPCSEGTSIFKFDIILNYKLWAIIQKYYNGKPTLIFCNTRKSVIMTAEALSREITVGFSPEQRAKLTALASTLKNKKLQMLVMSGVGCHHAGLLYEERVNIEQAFRHRDLPILITTTTLAMGVNLPAHLVIIKNTQQYVNGAYQEYSISTVLQMVGRAGRPQFDTEATAVIMTRINDKARYQSLVGGSEPLQSYLHKRIAENLNSEAALGTVTDVAQCVEWLRSTFLYVRAAKDPRRYLGLPPAAPMNLISKKIEELCVKAMNGLASSGLITMDEACCIGSTEAGRLMSVFYLDVETMKNIMKIEGIETLDQILWVVCESHELSDMHLRMDERRCLNLLNRNNAAATIRFPMKGKISTRQMKLNCIIQAVLGCLVIPEPSLNQEAMKVMKIASRVCTCLVRYVTRPDPTQQPQYSAVLNSIVLAKCIEAHLWENSPYVSRQLKGIGPTFSTLLASAGLTSFMLLEESHPRDLERIMNKGPPAGNVLRKQVSLLPKYQLTVTPIDTQIISVQLMLLNHAYLSENMDHLTAGDSHKSYLIIGDSENHLLLLKPFTDKDLISVYDGTMTFEIRRKHINEHTVIVNCISSQIAGIDAHVEYLFQDLAPPTHCLNDFRCPNHEPPKKNIAKKQSIITDVYKQRKRPNTSPNKITQCKEKIKRDNALTQKLKALKESFGRTSKELKKDMDKSTKMSSELLSDLLDSRGTPNNPRQTQNLQESKESPAPTVYLSNNVGNASWEDTNIMDEEDDYIDDVQIDNILNNIENEITGNHHGGFQNVALRTMPCNNSNEDTVQRKEKCGGSKNIDNKSYDFIEPSCRQFGKDFRKRKNIHTKSNFSVVDFIEKKSKTDVSDHVDLQSSDNRFSDTIKCNINEFLGRANDSKLLSREIGDLLYKNNDTELPEVHVKAPRTTENKVKTQENTTKYVNAGASTLSGDNDDNINVTKFNMSTSSNSHNIRPEVIATDIAKYGKFTTTAENNALILNMTANTVRNIETNKQFHQTNEDTLPAVNVRSHQTIQNNTNVQYSLNTTTDEPSATNNKRQEISLNTGSKDMNSELKTTDIDYDKSGELIMATENNDQLQNGDKRIADTYNENALDTKLYSVETKQGLNYESTGLNDNDITYNNIRTQSITTSTKSYNASTNNNSLKNNTLGCNQSEIDFSKNERLDELREITELNQYQNPTNNNQIDNNDNTSVPFVKTYTWPKLTKNCFQQRMILHTDIPAMPLIPQLRTPASIPQYIAMPDRLIGIRSKEVTRYKPPTVNENSAVNLYQHPEYHAKNLPDQTLFNNQRMTYSQNEIPKQQQNSCNSQNVLINNSKCITFSQNKTVNSLHNSGNSKTIIPCYDENETEKTHIIDDICSQNEVVKQQQNSSNSARFIPCFGKKGKTHVNRYSYTATKVDVHTKNALDHQLRITRKLKVDVDITEIVTQQKTKINKEKPKNIFFDITPNSRNDYNSDIPNDERNIRNVEMSRNEQQLRIKEKAEDITNIQNDYISNVPNDEIYIRNVEMSGNERQLRIKENAEDITRYANHHPPNGKCSAEDKTINSISINGFNRSSNNITNILQKYSKILSKPEIRTTPTMNNTNKNDSGYCSSASKTIGSQSSTVKTRRPFRIKDINTADLPLPDAIIEAKTTATPIQPRINLETLKVEIKNESEVASQNIALEQPHEYDCDVPNYNINEKFPLNELPIPDQSLDLDPDKKLEDENMLNPKMLLQYFSTDSSESVLPTDILAPPAEFTDNPAVYSPSIPTHMESPSFYDLQNPVNQYSEEEMLDRFNYSDNLHSSRASPNEVETWCLSREDECDDFEMQQSPAPWIVSPRAGSSRISSDAGSSRNRLGQFKFVRKKQLRP